MLAGKCTEKICFMVEEQTPHQETLRGWGLKSEGLCNWTEVSLFGQQRKEGKTWSMEEPMKTGVGRAPPMGE